MKSIISKITILVVLFILSSCTLYNSPLPLSEKNYRIDSDLLGKWRYINTDDDSSLTKFTVKKKNSYEYEILMQKSYKYRNIQNKDETISAYLTVIDNTPILNFENKDKNGVSQYSFFKYSVVNKKLTIKYMTDKYLKDKKFNNSDELLTSVKDNYQKENFWDSGNFNFYKDDGGFINNVNDFLAYKKREGDDDWKDYFTKCYYNNTYFDEYSSQSKGSVKEAYWNGNVDGSGMATGHGLLVISNGEQFYYGDMSNGNKDGFGSTYSNTIYNGKDVGLWIYTGEYKKGLAEGRILETLPTPMWDAKAKFVRGDYKNGKPINNSVVLDEELNQVATTYVDENGYRRRTDMNTSSDFLNSEGFKWLVGAAIFAGVIKAGADAIGNIAASSGDGGYSSSNSSNKSSSEKLSDRIPIMYKDGKWYYFKYKGMYADFTEDRDGGYYTGIVFVKNFDNFSEALQYILEEIGYHDGLNYKELSKYDFYNE